MSENTNDQGRKGDAPWVHVFEIEEQGSGRFMIEQVVSGPARTIHLIEHSAYLALAKELAEAKAQLQMTNSNWPHEKKLHEQLTAARQEIESERELRKLMLTQANVRIAELEETIKNDPKFDCFISRKELLDLRACKKREQKLVECLEMFVGYCTDEFAPTPMKLARELLKAHRGER